MVRPQEQPAELPNDAQAAVPNHVARHFSEVPDAKVARKLLAELNASVCLFSPRAARQPLVLYGAGNMGRLARDHLRAIGLDFQMVVDRDADSLRDDPSWRGITLARPQDVPGGVKNTALLAVSIATSPFVPLEAALQEAGWTDVVPFYDLAESFREEHPLSNGWFAGSLDPQSLARTEDVLHGWSDDLSRAHHLQFLAWRIVREEWIFHDAPVTGHDRFFIPEVMACLGEEEMFIDGGAHHGSVTEKFVDLTEGRFTAISAIEPDMESGYAFELFRMRMEPNTAARITLLPYALDAEERDRLFHDGLGYASQLAQSGQLTLRTRTLDSLELSPSFIKLHLEGAECDALQGALETIRKHRPIVAVTTYHNDDGIWRTPLFLMEKLKDYRFLMRLHSWCGTGAVVYAIPIEREEART